MKRFLNFLLQVAFIVFLRGCFHKFCSETCMYGKAKLGITISEVENYLLS